MKNTHKYQGPGRARRIALAVLIGVATLWIIGSFRAQGPFDTIVVLGDSLSDTGNAARFSNGPVWVEYLASKLGASVTPSQRGGSNYAIGGARLDPDSGSNSLRAQADRMLATPRDQSRTLYIVWGGANDVLTGLTDASGKERIEKAAASLKSIVADLVKVGAQHIVLPNLPDAGIAPVLGPEAKDAARELSAQFNQSVDAALRDLAPNGKGRFYRLDVWSMVERARKDPAGSGFTDVDHPCQAESDCDGYLFWDQVHPTTDAHSRLAEAAFKAIIPPEPPTQ